MSPEKEGLDTVSDALIIQSELGKSAIAQTWKDARMSYDQAAGSWKDLANVATVKSGVGQKSGISRSMSYVTGMPVAKVAEPEIERTEKKVFDSEVTDLVITGAGVIEDQWDVRQNIPAMIIEHNEDIVTMECMIDESNLKTQKRLFKTDLLKGAVELKRGTLVLIKTYQRPGKLNIAFVNGKGLFRSNLFIDAAEKEKAFEGIEKGILDKPIKFPTKK